MTRILAIAAILTALCPTLSTAQNTLPVQKAVIRQSANMSVRPPLVRICYARNYRCDRDGDCCSGNCYDNGGSRYCGD